MHGWEMVSVLESWRLATTTTPRPNNCSTKPNTSRREIHEYNPGLEARGRKTTYIISASPHSVGEPKAVRLLLQHGRERSMTLRCTLRLMVRPRPCWQDLAGYGSTPNNVLVDKKLASSNVILNPTGDYGLQTIGLSGLGRITD